MDTPRTDAETLLENGEHDDDVDADFARQLERELAAKQAQIDRLMLEYCPDEMTPGQMENWRRHQVVAPGALT